MDKNVYKIAGVSTLNENVKLRFAKDLVQRLSQLGYHGHTDIQLIELPEAMSKLDAALHLQAHEAFQGKAAQDAIAAFVAKNTPKAPAQRGRPMKLPTLADVPTRANGKFISRAVREQMLEQMVADAIAKKEADRAKREARAAAKAAEAADA